MSVLVGETVAMRGSGRSHAGRARIRNIGVRAGDKLRGSSEIDGAGARVCVSDPPVPQNYERFKLLPLTRHKMAAQDEREPGVVYV